MEVGIEVYVVGLCESGDRVSGCTFLNVSTCSSFGVVMWELLTGEKPYTGLGMCAIIFGVGNGTLSLPIPEGCPDFLKHLLNGMLIWVCGVDGEWGY